MSYSSLVSYVKLSPNCTKPRSRKIDTITIHHMAGNLSVEACGEVFQEKYSSNYGIGSDGRIACYVEEENAAWTSSSSANDSRAITIEVANNSGSPEWTVSAKAYTALIDLCVDICKRYKFRLNYTGDKKGNLTMHRWFASTLCPGPYLASLFPTIAAEVNDRLDGSVPEKIVYQPTVKQWQRAAIADGYEFPNFGADGIWGEECEKVAAAAIVKRRFAYQNKALTTIVQNFVGVNPDGLCGLKTESAIRKWQRDNGLLSDGAVGINSWKKMLGV